MFAALGKIRWMFFLFAGLMFLVLGYLTYGLLDSFREQMQAARTFEPVPAVVLESEVRRRPGNKGGDSFSPYVRYAYEVDPKRYESDRFFILGWEFNDYAEARSMLENYPAGATVTAYYDPLAPEIAVLDRSLPAGSLPILC